MTVQYWRIKMAAELYETVAWGRKSNGEKFEKMTIKRNLPGDDDVTFDLKYCGICHTDVHIANNDMGHTHYPVVPGHELAGVVTAVGSKVTGFKVGDQVGVGCIVDSCMLMFRLETKLK
ncbi:probable cinnamyl alcohol dehydrogenase 6 [Eurytemora carolleeae]|uniref:probable cinnamyl alcohol dehydrogenase 6 n=1 Tax=Eurytemora carolleeae TaxID=1294199 RepID=UPI000C789997|nr:probable cinnamyl alcohol dehydrogenase 6 [Eurytemora carolleeae]|eukprot:XP_023321347.1 probable cinnamyl alcohol dehydrogenase 6 [Eurytemora affinis]